MIKFLLLALVGLGLGGGVWKAQNPDGTLDDLKAQSLASFNRLKAGVDTVIDNPQALVQGSTVDSGSASAEQQPADISSAEVESLLTSVDEKLAASTDANNVRLNAIDEQLEQLTTQLSQPANETGSAAQQETLEALQSRIDDIQSNLDERNTTIAETLDAISEQTDNLGLRLGTLAGGTATDATADPEAQSVLSASIDARLEGIEQRLETVNTDSRRIQTLTEQLAAAEEKIAELEQSDSDSEQAIEQLSSSLDALNMANETVSIDTIQAQISDQLSIARSQFDSTQNNANVEQLENLLELTRDRIETLEQRVQDLPEASGETNEAQQTQDELQSQIAELEQRLETMSSPEDGLADEVNDVKEQVEQLSAKSFVTREEFLEQQTESRAIEYKIYFDRNSAEITDDAARVLNSFIAQEQNRTTGITIYGFTDRSGSAAYNQQLALQRAANARSYLIQNGIDFSKIEEITSLGEDAAAAVLPDETASAQQRVVILYAAQP